MSEAALDGKKWAKWISECEALKALLRDKRFLEEQVKLATTLYGNKGVNAIYSIESLATTLEWSEKVRQAVESMPNGNETSTRKIILHWYAILVYETAKGYNLIRITETGGS